MATKAIWPPRNKLLNLLPRHDLDRLRTMLEPVVLKPRRALFQPNAPVEHIYFIEEGLISVSALVDERRTVEVWLTGREGVIAIPVVLGSTVSPHRRIAPLGGMALRMLADHAREAMRTIPSFNRLLLRYVHAVLVQTAQVGACKSAHRLDQRLARWLATACDRSEDTTLPLTHDILSRMLGVRRASVTDAIAALDAKGVVQTARGRIRILDRDALEERSCRCYHIMKAEYERMNRDLRAEFRCEDDPRVSPRAARLLGEGEPARIRTAD